MTKTPLDRLQSRRRDELKVRQAEIEREFADKEKMVRAMSDAALSPDQRLKLFKGLSAWPRIVLGMYKAELAIAQRDRNEGGHPEYNDEPSDIAYNLVGDALGLGPDRIRDICRDGRRHLEQGWQPQQEITAAEFKRMLSAVTPEDVAAEYRKIFSERKKDMLSVLMEKFSTGKPF